MPTAADVAVEQFCQDFDAVEEAARCLGVWDKAYAEGYCAALEASKKLMEALNKQLEGLKV